MSGLSPAAAAGSSLGAEPTYEAHDPIMILSDDDFTPENGVRSGSGTADDPYIISGWEIHATDDKPYGIMVAGTTAYFKIVDCRIIGPGGYVMGSTGISIWYCQHFLGVESCHVEGFFVGMGSVNSSSPILYGHNTVAGCCHGIWVFNQTAPVLVEGCTIHVAACPSPPGGGPPDTGIMAYNSANITVNGCSIDGPGTTAYAFGIVVFYGKNITVTNSTLEELGSGVALINCTRSAVEGCSVHECHAPAGSEMPGFAVGMGNSSYIAVENVEAEDCDIGILVMNVSYMRLGGNNITGTGFVGLNAIYLRNALIEHNRIEGFSVGMWIDGPNDHITVRENLIAFSTALAMNVSGTNIAIYYNDFVENGKVSGSQAYDMTGATWYNTTTNRGNYWSDWTEPDADGNGIVDNPYQIAGPAGSQDPYPLATPSTDAQGPSISDISWTPTAPGPGESVVVRAKVTDPSGVHVVLLRYRTDGTWTVVLMTPAGGGFYEATIPGQDAGTTVHFKVWANDTLGNPSESSEHGYTVTTPDTEGPTIANITASPSEPREGEDITIGADVADPSGVDEVILSYSTDGGTTWENTTMTHTSGNRYEGTVPGQAAGTTITYKIYARDSVGNWAVSDEHTITVRSAGILPPQIMGVPTLFLIGGVAGLAIALGGLAVFLRMRK